jgi:acyl transferase domain-containing protein/NADP-dependent 3-hydroxy acid dehydrogenase YdfG
MSDQTELLQRALDAIDDLSTRLERSEARRREPIAVVGMACRFPGGSDTPEAYWRLLRDGRSGIVEIPGDRWDVDDWYDPDLSEPGTMYTRSGGFLGPVDRFDAGLFRISPREAATMDPQQRLLLECAWEALENAGIAPDSLGRTETGVFVGITSSDYARLLRIGREDSDVYSATGTALNAAAGRIAFVLGLQGPCMAIDTACSSSLVAAHVACQSLRAGECGTALVGGVNVMLSPENFALFSKWGMISRSGECRAFDDDASGFVRGEGCGMLVLKRLSDAERDHDRILAIIRGSAVNQDGPSSGLSVPNGPAQVKVIRAALEHAGVEPREIDFVEAHGTGTPLGDPIEVEALGEVYASGRGDDAPLMIGSVKPSIGHTESAAGTAGLIKLILALRHGEIPPQRSFDLPNTRIDWDRIPVEVVNELREWPEREGRPRLGGVSSFGFSGTNVHMIVEGVPAEAVTPSPPRARLLPLSARSPSALHEAASALADRLASDEAPATADVARTLMTGRATLPCRAAVVGETAEVLVPRLRALAEGRPSPGMVEGHVEGTAPPRVAFLYSGQGSQYPRMGMALRETQPDFREAFDRCASLVLEAGGPDLLGILSSDDEDAVHQTAVTQPALFALEYALTDVLRIWNIRPAAVLGHSIGEIVAACVAEVMSLEDAIRLVVERGRLMQALPAGGGMLAAECSAEVALAVAEPFRQRVSLAGRNGPESVVLSGGLAELDEIAAAFADREVRTRPLTVSHAFHSPLMEPMRAEFSSTLATLDLRAPRLPLVSNLSGTIDPGAGATADYWSRHVREGVAFEPSMRSLVEEGYRVFLEIGPRPVLSGMATRFLDLPDATWATTLRGRGSEAADLLEGVGRLFTAGVRPGWEAILGGEGRATTLPTYPFQREHHWAAAAPSPRRGAAGDTVPRLRLGKGSSHPLLGEALPSPLSTVQIPCDLDIERHPLLAEHRVAGLTVFPASGYIELARAAMEELDGEASVRITDGRFEAALILGEVGSDEDAPDVVLTLESEGDRAAIFQVHGRRGRGARGGTGWTRHACARVGSLEADRAATEDRPADHCTEDVDIEAYQARLVQIGLDYGPEFRTLVEARRGEREAVGTVRLPESHRGTGLGVHPGLLDAAFHLIGLAAEDPAADGEDRFLLPTAFEAVSVHTSPGPEVTVHCRIRESGPTRVVADLELRHPDGSVAVTIEGLETRRVGREQFRSALGIESVGPLLTLDWAPAEPATDPVPGRWGIVGGSDALGTALAEALIGAGLDARVLSDDEAKAIASDTGDLDGLVDLGGTELQDDAADTPPSDLAARGPTGRSLERLAALARGGAELPIVIVTRRAQQLDAAELVRPAAAVLWGIGATADAELAATPVTLVDIGDPETDLGSLAALVAAAGPERRLAVRDGAAHAARIVPAGEANPGIPDAPRTLEIRERGSLDGLEIRTTERGEPGPGQVEIEVMASGLNFRDVLNLLDMYPGEPGPPGNECAGRVVAVGDGVRAVRPGDLVTCIAERTFGSHVLAGESMVFPVPPGLSIAQASVFPIAQLTAWLGLHRLGGIGNGDMVLIHAGAGGVGLAAVHLALAAGAHVIATAGSGEKRDFLRRIGVAHVFDSRSTLHAETLLEATGGRGVDIVLNSLTGDAIDEGIRSLATGGRFVEIGLRDLRTADEIASLRDDVTYTTTILGDWCRDDPDAVREMWDELVALLAAGRIPPPRVRRFPLDRVGDAFTYMARARHIGRIAITHPGEASACLRPDGAVLVTGGLGALGLHVAEGLADRGAGALVLVGRSEPSEVALKRIGALRDRGVDVRVVAGDVTRAEDVAALVSAEMPPIRGVVHAAGVVDDALLARHDGERLRRVLAPKADGAVELLAALDGANVDLDLLLFFSSGSAVLGSPGQAAYAGANAYLDALARRLRAEGRAATSIGWGAWAGDGMASAVDERTARQWESRGIGTFAPEEALAALDDALATGLSWLAALPMEWPKFLAALDGVPPLLSRLAATSGGAGPHVGRGESGVDAAAAAEALLDELAPLPAVQRVQLLRGRLGAEVAAVLGMADAAELEPRRGFAEQGMDSLMAVELAGRLGAICGIDLPSTFLFDQPTLDALTSFLLESLEGEGRLEGTKPPKAETEEHQADPLAAALDEMSEDELAAELARELGDGEVGA